MGRPLAARVDAPAHERPGRDRPVRVHLGARVHDRGLVGPLGERQPLRAQDALRGEAHGRPTRSGPSRAGTASSRTSPTRSPSTAASCGSATSVERGRDREPTRSRAWRSRASRGSSRTRLRGRGDRGRLRDLHPARLARAAGRAGVGAARLVRRPDQHLAQDQFRIAWLGLYLAADEPVPVLDRRELSTWLARARPRASRASSSSRPRWTRRPRPRASTCTSCGGIIPGAKGTRRALPRRDVRAVRARHRRRCTRASRTPIWRRRHLVFEPSLRRDPEARPGRHVPAALARAERRGPLLRLRDVPQPRHRRRPRRPRRR